MWAYNVPFKNQRPPNKKPQIWHKRRLFFELFRVVQETHKPCKLLLSFLAPRGKSLLLKTHTLQTPGPDAPEMKWS